MTHPVDLFTLLNVWGERLFPAHVLSAIQFVEGVMLVFLAINTRQFSLAFSDAGRICGGVWIQVYLIVGRTGLYLCVAVGSVLAYDAAALPDTPRVFGMFAMLVPILMQARGVFYAKIRARLMM